MALGAENGISFVSRTKQLLVRGSLGFAIGNPVPPASNSARGRATSVPQRVAQAGLRRSRPVKRKWAVTCGNAPVAQRQQCLYLHGRGPTGAAVPVSPWRAVGSPSPPALIRAQMALFASGSAAFPALLGAWDVSRRETTAVFSQKRDQIHFEHRERASKVGKTADLMALASERR